MAADPLDAQLERARDLGFLGPGPVEAHRAHAQRLVGALRQAGVDLDEVAALDLGSGGGVPGLLLAWEWPHSTWVLLDANERRTTFLAESIAELGLGDRVEVRRDRAERAGRDPGLRGRFDLVTARSFGAPPVTAECGGPFLAEGGVLAVSEPPERDPSRWPVLGLEAVGLTLVGAGSWAVIRRVAAVPERFPRREGVPAKRPLW